jgi:hypothetical protein
MRPSELVPPMAPPHVDIPEIYILKKILLMLLLLYIYIYGGGGGGGGGGRGGIMQGCREREWVKSALAGIACLE